MTPLGALIKQARDKFLAMNGVELSYGDIARRSGGRLTRTRVQQLATGPIRAMPSKETIEGLALGLTVTTDLVVLRALESAGYPLPSTQRRQTHKQIDDAISAVETLNRQLRALDKETPRG